MSSNAQDTVIRFDIVKNRRKFYLLSAVILTLGLVFTLILGLDLGVDFKAGTRLDMYIGKEFNVGDIEAVLHKEVPDVKFKDVTKTGDKNLWATTTFDQPISKDKLETIHADLKQKYGDQVERQESTVDPIIADEMVKKAAIALVLAALGIAIYIAFRFQYLFGIACTVSLIHDAFIPIAMFSIFRIEVDLTFVAAILTIVGYSINDTIVIFDRIRENLRSMKVKTVEDLEHLVNVSLWQTMRRSVFTVLTVFVAALALAVFGSEGIRNFSLALIFGLVTGTYSSIFIAAQVWVTLKKREMMKKRLKPAANPNQS
ncbi:protein translocase subunit SecF [Brevibacillus sp. B_LB10_24]|uniref:protein translocase subunit SecF n=1 Tax=Brevibacillus sp. B_LB10_24 TaxID=3380645 RepID=UPI0038BB5E2C